MTSGHSPFRATRRQDDEASAWYARHEGGLTPEEREEFQQWLQADPSHALVWREYAGLLEPLSSGNSGTWKALLAERARRRQRARRRTVAFLGATLGAVALAAFIHFSDVARQADPVRPMSALALAAPDKIALPDGTIVELAPGAEVTHEYSETRRLVRLLAGTAYFEVTPDPRRPFVVSVAAVEVRAVGTAFSVSVDPGSVNVLVTHGRVAVERTTAGDAPERATPVFADAGNRVVVDTSGKGYPDMIQQVAEGEVLAQLAWRGPRLDLSGTPLSEVIVAMNAANRIQLHAEDRRTGDLRLTGVFRADNAEGFARMLQNNYGVIASREGDVIRLRSPAH